MASVRHPSFQQALDGFRNADAEATGKLKRTKLKQVLLSATEGTFTDELVESLLDSYTSLISYESFLRWVYNEAEPVLEPRETSDSRAVDIASPMENAETGDWIVAERGQALAFGTKVERSSVTIMGRRGLFEGPSGQGILVELVEPSALESWQARHFEPPLVSLEVSMVSGEVLPPVSASLYSTVSAAKDALEATSGIGAKRQKLLADDRELQDEEMLSTIPAFQRGETVALSLVKAAPELDKRLLMVGLDGAGKTTLLYRLVLNEVVTTIPTIGFNVETVKFETAAYTIWDVGGGNRVRALWRHYYNQTDGIILVVDSSDRERIHEVRTQLDNILLEDELRDAILLVYANKQDLPNALSVSELREQLNLHNLHDRIWHVQAAVAHQGDGLQDGLNWMTTAFTNIMDNTSD
eukprot:TRINITY_DN33353_c0_g1_i1.p1 TRINITY_DN33353_c0_g1~~TRINITY_DN33353_c0_g1_i1.p1  ORF type:complete len:412 (-),score=45.73 TRINITY_DN33353_c0_g1_i1:150-1385(-)